MLNKNVSIIGVTGASGSGKTFFSKKLYTALGKDAVIISQDSYYKEQTLIPFEERTKNNYDHPEAVDFNLLIQHIHELKKNQSVQCPVYDFSIHNRKPETVLTGPARVVIIDGILLLSVPEMRDVLDMKIYVETPLDLCFIRRLKRDTQNRGRTMDSIVTQYLETVRPMYLQYVYPSREFADFIIDGEKNISPNIIEIKNKIVKALDAGNW